MFDIMITIIIVRKYTKPHWSLSSGNEITNACSLFFPIFSNISMLNNYINLGGKYYYSIKDMG